MWFTYNIKATLRWATELTLGFLVANGKREKRSTLRPTVLFKEAQIHS